ncbi:hypothetical protein U0070_026454, partial [Myodes glareolus]
PTCWAGGISQALQSCDIIANPPMVSSNGSGVIKAGLAGDRFLSTVFTLCWLKPWRGSSSSDQKERRTRASSHVLTWCTLGFRTGTMHLATPGDRVTHAVPIYESIATANSTMQVGIAGRDISGYLWLLLHKAGADFHALAEFESGRPPAPLIEASTAATASLPT